ncbi:hypothetical protein B0T24DRAFT_216912 [Lasiosphaeria ovina]|uniref:Uncharacterized protein n=1 Tax=Lasiosphaeria ovina TaxID=92902 RepID=A0AAE0KGB0_9PEZI|nr:hypothetical protein B0T24DRAFT_216912 [Lasiosphaeria ovina]
MLGFALAAAAVCRWLYARRYLTDGMRPDLLRLGAISTPPTVTLRTYYRQAIPTVLLVDKWPAVTCDGSLEFFSAQNVSSHFNSSLPSPLPSVLGRRRRGTGLPNRHARDATTQSESNKPTPNYLTDKRWGVLEASMPSIQGPRY